MTRKEADTKIDDLSNQKTKLETSIAVLSSDMERQQEALKDAAPKVEEIVGSTDVESIKTYLGNLDNDIQLDIAKLNEME